MMQCIGVGGVENLKSEHNFKNKDNDNEKVKQ